MTKTHELVPGCHICEHFGRLGSERAIWSDDHWVADGLLDVPGWIMVATRRHAEGSWALSDEEAAGFGLLLRNLSSAVKVVTGAERVHIAAAGESAPHFHYILIPRRPGEIPVLDGKTVILRAKEMADRAQAAKINDLVRDCAAASSVVVSLD
jgi:diadenosine tetraphosphate (Ap4A) HIT family hydrolase